MAKTTTAALQGAINTLSGHDIGSPNQISILKEEHLPLLYSRWYVTGSPKRVSLLKEYQQERTMWCQTTWTNSAADQAAEVLAALESSDPSSTVTTDANVDPDVGP